MDVFGQSHDQVGAAAILLRSIISQDFSEQLALVCVGVPCDLAVTTTYVNNVRNKKRWLEQNFGNPNRNCVIGNEQYALNRFKVIWTLSKKLPLSKHPLHNYPLYEVQEKRQSDAMMLAGFQKKHRAAGSCYMKCKRFKDTNPLPQLSKFELVNVLYDAAKVISPYSAPNVISPNSSSLSSIFTINEESVIPAENEISNDHSFQRSASSNVNSQRL